MDAESARGRVENTLSEPRGMSISPANPTSHGADSASRPTCRAALPSDDSAWNEFVSNCSEATVYHSTPWRDFVTNTFGQQSRYVLAETSGKIRGVLPLFQISAPLLGSKMISMPYDVASGGPLTADPGVARALAEAAALKAKQQRVDYLELRCPGPSPALEALGFRRSEPVLISDLELSDEQTIWKSLKPDRRKSVGRAARRGVTVREASSFSDLESYYRAYLIVFRDFGTPPYGRRYLSGLWADLHPTGLVRVLLAEVDGKCVGGAMLFVFGRTLIAKITICLPEALPLRATGALYWKTIQLALEEGCTRLSFGSSSRHQKGLIEYKEGWGAVTRPAAFYSLPIRGKVPSIEKYFNSDGLPQKVWRKLPLGLTPLIGHPLNRWFC